MNLEDIKSNTKKGLKHSRHGGEIYHFNSTLNLNSIIDFSTNINSLISPEFFIKSYRNAVHSIPMYPDSNSTQLKREILKNFGNRINIENVIVGSGSMELISLFCEMFINPGDEIIICQPTFLEYAWAVKKFGGKIVNIYRSSKSNFQIKSESVINKLNSNTKIIFICNPNNPNGYLDNKYDLEKVIKCASVYNVLVFLDEAFMEFAGEYNSFIPKISEFDNLFICRSFSKFFGLTGLRIGFGISSPELIRFINSGQVLWPVNCIGQRIAQEILKSKKFIYESLNFFAQERIFLLNELRQIPGLKVFPTNTNYILVNTEETGIESSKIKQFMINENILIRDCSNYEGLDEFYIRVSIRTHELNQKLIQGLKKNIAVNK